MAVCFLPSVLLCSCPCCLVHVPNPLYSLCPLLFIFPPKSDDCLSGKLCGNHLSPAQGSPCGCGGDMEGTVRSGKVLGCWVMESTGSQLDCPLSGEILFGQSCVCPSCQDCPAAHRSASLSESAPSLSPAAPPCPTWLCLNLKSWVWRFWSGFCPDYACFWMNSRRISGVWLDWSSVTQGTMKLGHAGSHTLCHSNPHDSCHSPGLRQTHEC